jgi:hypothetical protein
LQAVIEGRRRIYGACDEYSRPPLVRISTRARSSPATTRSRGSRRAHVAAPVSTVYFPGSPPNAPAPGAPHVTAPWSPCHLHARCGAAGPLARRGGAVSNYHATRRILAGKRVFSVVSLEEDKREQLTGAFIGRGSGKGQTLQSPAQRRGGWSWNCS